MIYLLAYVPSSQAAPSSSGCLWIKMLMVLHQRSLLATDTTLPAPHDSISQHPGRPRTVWCVDSPRAAPWRGGKKLRTWLPSWVGFYPRPLPTFTHAIPAPLSSSPPHTRRAKGPRVTFATPSPPPSSAPSSPMTMESFHPVPPFPHLCLNCFHKAFQTCAPLPASCI